MTAIVPDFEGHTLEYDCYGEHLRYSRTISTSNIIYACSFKLQKRIKNAIAIKVPVSLSTL